MNSIVLGLSAFLAVSFFVVSLCNHCPPIKWKGVHQHTSIKNVNIETRVFATVSGVDLNGCIDNCQRRGVCQYINYHTSAHVCFLIEPLSEPITEDNMVYDDTHFVFGNKSEWAEENWGQNYLVCRNCSERQVCTIEDDVTVTCTFKECPAPPVIDDAELLGNKYTIGSRLRYRCTNDKTKKSGGIVCQTNGTWSTVDFTCQEPATTEPATTEQATTEPATTEQATTEQATTEPATTEQATTEQATTEQATTEPATTEQATTEPATTEQATTEPATTEQATTEPSTTEQATTEQAITEPATTEQVTTEQATTEPATTEPATTEQATTEPATTEPATTEQVTTEQATTEPATTEPVTTEQATTEPATTEPATTEQVTTEQATTEPAITEPATTEQVTTEQATTESATTEPATTEQATTEPATTEPATTEQVTTEQATTEPATTEPATTEQVTCLIEQSNLPALTTIWNTPCQFAIVENPVSKAEAVRLCREDSGGKLVQILNDSKLDDLKSLPGNDDKRYWIDVQRENDADEPKCKCVHFENNPHLHDCECGQTHPFICER